MKKNLIYLALFVFILLGFIIFSGCKKEQKLYIYNWSYYIPENVLRDFEKKFHCKVIYDVFSSNEEMYAKLKAGGAGYDLVFPSGDFTSIMIKEDMVDKLDKTKILNFQNLDKAILSKIKFDPNNEYSVPYMMGAVGISVNKKHVKDYPKDFSIYNDARFKDKMTLLDDMREVLGAGLASLGYSVNSKNPAELEQAKQVVLGWKKNILKFDAESFGKGFANEEFWIVQGYAENVFLELNDEQKKSVDFFIPKKGGTMYIDSMLILKGARNKELAYKFMNYIHEPKVFAKITDFLYLPSINVPARLEMKVNPNYQIEDMANCEFKEDLGDGVELWNKIWQEINIQS
jgi:spermidine/putrescine transport system substrate-binding protein